VELERPPGVPDELWARVLAHQREAVEYEEREKRLLSSLSTGDERMLDRALGQLEADKARLKTRQESLAVEMRGHGVDI